ncbi:MAG: DUF1345 domain-containing protein [Pseudotabrizicola sp.]|uniref:DUF1345 domain-containing protein n=1 Tax=Pseudotabrizicola sp. TaxID=2939647 RepID=UPI00271D65A9|nr:DUF1345 domain-containing protein [Pseudotabrizicola sp.]MDO8882585.1 DUF1345 domain-containing protein [Pseudotabrizicola sp.]MDP2079732.1 DUF1345 domain-containing protein [Pseudotabrizicola sp.]MDZ7575681.1 DUF1345 domain-containing protein [Pseudotabrizicola sp.]
MRLSQIPHGRFLLFMTLFVVSGGLLGIVLPPEQALVSGFNLGAIAFLLMVWQLWRGDGPEAARARSARDDGGRWLMLLAMTASVASALVALGVMTLGQDTDILNILTATITIILAWVFSNTVMALHYAHLWYGEAATGDVGGIDFPGEAEPVFADFVYVAFVIGMTAQVADTNLTSRQMRRVVTLHGFCAFMFNLGILALVVNMLAGLL